jgi:hypothetical protein
MALLYQFGKQCREPPSARTLHTSISAGTSNGAFSRIREGHSPTVEIVAQTILRLGYTKLGVAEQGDAAELEA